MPRLAPLPTWSTLKEILTGSDRDTPEGFNTFWRAVGQVMDGELWGGGGFSSERAFLKAFTDGPPRKARKLAAIALHEEAWTFRGQSNHKLRAVKRLVVTSARAGANLEDVEVNRRTRGELVPQDLSATAPRFIRRKVRQLERAAPGSFKRGELVVLLHGLGRTRFSMRHVERELLSRGFQVANVGYPSTRAGVEALAELSWSRVHAHAGAFEQVHFVTHSLGGILLRQLLAWDKVALIGRVLMLAPPNHGSEVVDHLRRWPVVPSLMGPAFLELGTGPQGPERLGPARAPTAVIAGSRPQFFLSRSFDRPNDGKVAVESA